MLLLFGPVMLLSWLSDREHQQIDRPPLHVFTQVWFGSAAPLILPQRRSRAAAKLSHRGGCEELAQDPRTQSRIEV